MKCKKCKIDLYEIDVVEREYSVFAKCIKRNTTEPITKTYRCPKCFTTNVLKRQKTTKGEK